MKMKALALAAAAAMIVSLLAGCGNSAGGSAGTSSGDSGSAAAAVEAVETAAADAAEAGNASAADAVIRIGAKAFSENLIVAEVYALALEDAGYTVERDYNLSTNVVHEALINDELDLYPEYTGTSYLNMLGHETEFDRETVYNTVRDEYAENWNVTVLNETEINDTDCFVMLSSTAEELGIETLSDLQAHSSEIVWGSYTAAGQEDRNEMAELEAFYGPFTWKEVRSIDSSVALVALDNHEVDADYGLSTNPALLAPEYIIIREDIPCRVPYYLVPVVRTAVLEEYPDVADIVNEVSSYFDNETIMELVGYTDIDGEEYEDVALDFYESVIAQ